MNRTGNGSLRPSFIFLIKKRKPLFGNNRGALPAHKTYERPPERPLERFRTTMTTRACRPLLRPPERPPDRPLERPPERPSSTTILTLERPERPERLPERPERPELPQKNPEELPPVRNASLPHIAITSLSLRCYKI